MTLAKASNTLELWFLVCKMGDGDGSYLIGLLEDLTKSKEHQGHGTQHVLNKCQLHGR